MSEPPSQPVPTPPSGTPVVMSEPRPSLPQPRKILGMIVPLFIMVLVAVVVGVAVSIYLLVRPSYFNGTGSVILDGADHYIGNTEGCAGKGGYSA